MLIRLQKGLFEGDHPLSQEFGNKLIIDGEDVYAKWGLKGHNGIDYDLPTGTPLYCCINGTVMENRYDGDGYGNYILIENGACGVLYAHMKKSSDYKVGMKVPVGAFLGPSGNTGFSTASHLHFGLFPKPRDRKNGYNGYINPLDPKLVEWVNNLNTIVDLQELEKLQKELKGVRESRNNWRNSSNDFEKKLEREKKAHGMALDRELVLLAELEEYSSPFFTFDLREHHYSLFRTQRVGVPK